MFFSDFILNARLNSLIAFIIIQNVKYIKKHIVSLIYEKMHILLKPEVVNTEYVSQENLDISQKTI